MVPNLIFKRMLLLAIPVFVLLVSVPEHSQAQVTTTATLTGTVTDPQDKAIPQAQVVAKNMGTGIEYKTATNTQGDYRLFNLPPGVYTVSVIAEGFKVAVVNNITLTVNQSSTQNFAPVVGEVSQSVEVSGAAPLLQTGSASLGTIIDTRKVVDLPLNGRQFTELLLLVPGASPIDQKQDTIPGIGSTRSQLSGNTVIPPINGRPSRANLFYVDGIIDTETFFTGFAVSPSVDIIQEFNVETNNDQASSGLVTGGVVNAVTKSGTSQLHGSLYEFNRNKAVEARNFFDPSNRPNYNQNQFGGTLGGPIPHVRDTWFFGGYEGFRFVRGGNSQTRVPFPDERNGNFSSWLGPQEGTDALGRPVFKFQIFNPYTARETTAGQADPLTRLVATRTGFVREPFAGNIVPKNLWNPIVAYMRWLPEPNLAGQPGTALPNFINTQSARLDQDAFNIRLDHRFGPSDMVYGRYLSNNSTSFTPGAIPTGPSVGERNVRNVGVHWLHSFSPTLVMDLTAGFQQARNPGFVQQPADKEQMFKDVGFGIPDGAFFLGAGGLMPQMPSVGTGFGSVGSSAGSNLDPERITQLSGDITKNVGRHTLKGGGIWFHSRSNAINGCPAVSFSNLQTGDPSNIANTGLAFASFLLGDPSGGRIYAGDQGTIMSMDIVGFYAQDSFRVTPKLTLNYGLRWDHSTPPVEKKDRLAGFDWDTGLYVISGTKPPPDCAVTKAAPCIPGGVLPANVVMAGKRGDTDPVYDNWQPRLGLAYQLNDRTVVRLGTGTNFDNWAFLLQNAQDLRGAWPFGLNRVPQPDLNLTFFTNDAQHLVSGAGIIPPPTPFIAGSRVNSSKAKNAYVTRWNLDVQRQVTNSLTLDVAYVGSRGRRTYTGFIQNTALTPGPGLPISTRVPFPLLRVGANGGRTIGYSWYDALQVKAQQHLSHGLSFLVSYTWSKSLDTGCSGFAGIEGCSISNPYNIRGEKSVSSFDLPHMLSVSSLWELPFGKGRQFLNQRGIASTLAGNWQLNGIFRTFGGQPITVQAGADFANTGNGGWERPDQIGNPIPANRDRLNWFNRAAFAFPPDCRVVAIADCRFGTLGRNTLRGPGFGNLDFSVFRDFLISDRLGKIQFRAEFFNLTNHTNFTIGPFNSTLNLNSTTFGQIFSAAPSRQIQFAGKWIF